MKKALVISTNKYPNGNAGAVRQHSFAKLLDLCGYVPYVIGLGETTNLCERVFDGIQYISLRYKKNTVINRLFNRLLFARRLKKILKRIGTISCILVSPIPYFALNYLKNYALNNNIPLIFDCVEWYSPSEFSYGKCSPSYIVNNLYATKWIDSNFQVIAISKFLVNHYISRKVNALRIPVIMDIYNIGFTKRVSSSKLTLVYAGSPGKKDNIKDMIIGLSHLSTMELGSVEVRIIGITKDYCIRKLDISKEMIAALSGSLIFYGFIPRNVALKHLEVADFSILLRPSNERFAQAGFPTKVVESLASGTPLICNISSDLADYLIDEENALIVPNNNSMDFYETVQRAIQLNRNQLENMKYNARKTAEKYFDYSLYKNEMMMLIDR